MSRTFSLEEILDVLIAMDQGINPECYNTSKGLIPEDFFDAAYGKAIQLKITNEFLTARKIYSNYTKDDLRNYKPINLL